MTVVSNTSPLTSLAAIGHFDALRRQAGFFLGDRLYREVLAQAGEEA
jgi:predicted nucleic acid-binding protein